MIEFLFCSWIMFAPQICSPYAGIPRFVEEQFLTWSALWLHLELGEEHGVLCDQPLGTVPKCGVLYDCILNLGKSMEYFVTSPLALCQVWSALWLHLEFGEEHGVLCDQPLGTVPSVECFMTASWIWGRAWSTLWLVPWHCAIVWSALWLHLEFGEEHGVLCDQPLGTVP